ncbi:hypothetical protein [Campylobacter sp. RM16188]|uniref:hypothetical protein n=1 Tax=Campylobacter sp. RM16188 TaxID=1705725 RepID=UPI001556F7EA|nr:hypothetical protein [Campylobacter sp. RM16188]
MGQYAKKVKKYMNELQADYSAGFINYSRVENNYMPPEEAFELIPHKSLTPFNKALSPIKETELPLNKKNALLFLSQNRLITPSQAVNYAETLDEYFDNDLNFINENKKLELDRLFALMTKFLSAKLKTQELKTQENEIKSRYSKIYDSSRQINVGFYAVKSMTFFPNIDGQSKKKRSPLEVRDSFWYKKYQEKKRLENEEALIERFEYLEECLLDFREKIAQGKEDILAKQHHIRQLADETAQTLSKYKTKEQ